MHDGLRQDYSSPGGRHRVHGVKNWVSGATRINASVASVQHHSQVQGRAGELRRASGGAMLSTVLLAAYATVAQQQMSSPGLQPTSYVVSPMLKSTHTQEGARWSAAGGHYVGICVRQAGEAILGS